MLVVASLSGMSPFAFVVDRPKFSRKLDRSCINSVPLGCCVTGEEGEEGVVVVAVVVGGVCCLALKGLTEAFFPPLPLLTWSMVIFLPLQEKAVLVALLFSL